MDNNTLNGFEVFEEFMPGSVVNNGSTDGITEWLAAQEGLTVINQTNVGGAGGFYTGIQYAYQAGADWIWCMDDEVFPRADCLEQLLPYTGKKDIGILAPRRLLEGWPRPSRNPAPSPSLAAAIPPLRWNSSVLRTK